MFKELIEINSVLQRARFVVSNEPGFEAPVVLSKNDIPLR
jgi:hypothetical protein